MRALRPIWNLRSLQGLGLESRCNQEGCSNANSKAFLPPGNCWRQTSSLGSKPQPDMAPWAGADQMLGQLWRLSESPGEPGSWEECPPTPTGLLQRYPCCALHPGPRPFSHCHAGNSALLSPEAGCHPSQLSQRCVSLCAWFFPWPTAESVSHEHVCLSAGPRGHLPACPSLRGAWECSESGCHSGKWTHRRKAVSGVHQLQLQQLSLTDGRPACCIPWPPWWGGLSKFKTDRINWYSFFTYVFLLNIYLFAPGLSCRRGIFSCSTWDLVLQPGIEPGPPALGAESQTLDPQGSPYTAFLESNLVICITVLKNINILCPGILLLELHTRTRTKIHVSKYPSLHSWS